MIGYFTEFVRIEGELACSMGFSLAYAYVGRVLLERSSDDSTRSDWHGMMVGKEHRCIEVYGIAGLSV